MKSARSLMSGAFRTLVKSPNMNSSKSANPHPYTIVVEGNIGSGKTTFLQSFKKHEGLVHVYPEPVDKWRNLQGHNLLEKMYQDPKRNSLLLQTYIQLTMAQEHIKPCPAPIKIMERSLLRRAQLILRFCAPIFIIIFDS